MTTGAELYTFITGLNGGATIDPALLSVLVDNGKSVLEEERAWMVLRKTDKSKTVTTANTWQTAIDLSTISDFSRFLVNQAGCALKLFDGSERIQYYDLKPFDERLEWKNVSDTCVYDENAKILYLNGTVPFAGTLYIPYVSSSPAIDLAATTAVWAPFPSRFLPIIGYYAVGIYKGGVDFDSINYLMNTEIGQTMGALKNAMEKWDNEKQLAVMATNDPTEYAGGYPRAGAVNRD
jgi:hypothetical protein